MYYSGVIGGLNFKAIQVLLYCVSLGIIHTLRSKIYFLRSFCKGDRVKKDRKKPAKQLYWLK